MSHGVSNSEISNDSDIEVCIFIKTENIYVVGADRRGGGPGQAGWLAARFLGGSQASQS